MGLSKQIDEIISATRGTTLVAATKYVEANTLLQLLAKGINNFGENRVDSFLKKYDALKSHEEICWHFIGTLQTNKVAKMINKITYLHSLNSIKLARYIERYRLTPLKCFIEVNFYDSNKTGVSKEEALSLLKAINNYKNVEVIGLMTMTEQEFTDSEKQLTFKMLNDFKNELNRMGYNKITCLSMGMSDDYKFAIKEHSTHVRLGRILFEL